MTPSTRQLVQQMWLLRKQFFAEVRVVRRLSSRVVFEAWRSVSHRGQHVIVSVVAARCASELRCAFVREAFAQKLIEASGGCARSAVEADKDARLSAQLQEVESDVKAGSSRRLWALVKAL